MEGSAEILSTAAHVSFPRSSFKANERRGPPSRLLAINVVGDEALSSFLSNGPRRSRSLGIGGFAAGLQEPTKGLGDKVLPFWFAQQPFDGSTGMNLDFTQPLEIGLAIFHGQKWRCFSSEPALASVGRISKGTNDRNFCHFQLLDTFCQMSRKCVRERIHPDWF